MCIEGLRAGRPESDGDGNWAARVCAGWASPEEQERGVCVGVATGSNHFQPGARPTHSTTQHRAPSRCLCFCQCLPDEHGLHQQPPSIWFVLHYIYSCSYCLLIHTFTEKFTYSSQIIRQFVNSFQTFVFLLDKRIHCFNQKFENALQIAWWFEKEYVSYIYIYHRCSCWRGS